MLLTIAHFEANIVPVEGGWGRREHGDGGELEGESVDSAICGGGRGFLSLLYFGLNELQMAVTESSNQYLRQRRAIGSFLVGFQSDIVSVFFCLFFWTS